MSQPWGPVQTDALASTQKIEEIIPAVLRIIASTFGSEGAGYYEFGADGVIFLRFYLIGDEVLTVEQLLARPDLQAYDIPRILSQGFTVDDDYLGAPVTERVFTSIVDHHVGTSVPEFDNWARDHGWEMELNLPLVVGSKPFAALCLYHGAQRSYRPSEIELAEALVKQLSLAVQASRLAEDSRQKAMAETRQKAAQDRAEELTHANAMLMSSVEAVASSADLRALLEHFLLQAMKAAGARGGVVPKTETTG